MKITEKIRKIIDSRHTLLEGQFIWHGEHVDGVPTVTVDGVKHDAREIAKLMGIKIEDMAKYGIEHADMEQLHHPGDLEDTGDGDSESQE